MIFFLAAFVFARVSHSIELSDYLSRHALYICREAFTAFPMVTFQDELSMNE
jgi:hypothetical protein